MFQNREEVRTGLKIRLIERDDNSIVADIIRLVMTEFHAVGLGYSSNDSEIDDMYTTYAPDRSAFYVVEFNGQVLGCGGFAVVTGGLVSCVKCISALNYGVWGLLILCLEEAANAGFENCYLETTADMEQVQRLYGKYGFKYLDKPMGNTGHTDCGTWMAREL